MLERIDQTKLRESVYAALTDAFTTGTFAPGEFLSLRTLADQLGTSMTPVREAVRRLVAEGALIDTPNRKLQVPPFDHARLTDLMRARIALEPMLAKISTERMDKATLRTLESILAEPASKSEQPNLGQNYRFHFTLYNHSHSPVILPIVEGLWLQYGPYLNLMIDRAGPSIGRGNDIHEDIIEAVRNGNGDETATAVERDIRRSFGLIAGEMLPAWPAQEQHS